MTIKQEIINLNNYADKVEEIHQDIIDELAFIDGQAKELFPEEDHTENAAYEDIEEFEVYNRRWR